MKSISIYMTLIILFSINFRSACVGGDKDKQNTGNGVEQGYCNEEKKDQKQKEDTEDMQESEKGTRNLDVKHLTVPREQMVGKNSHMKTSHYLYSNYWFIDMEDGLYERNFFYDYYFYDEGDLDENFECCNCCEIL